MTVGAGDGMVQVAYLHRPDVSHSWHMSMMGMLIYDLGHGQRIAGAIPRAGQTGSLVEDRNWTVKQFLDEKPHEWLFLIDTDMGFAPDTIERLLDAADPATRPVVGALCFVFHEVAHDGMGGVRMTPLPTIYDMGKRPDGSVVFVNRWEYQKDTLTQAAGTGAACLLIHRSALEKIRANYGDVWFDQVRDVSGRMVGEDLAFCGRLGASGVPLFVHTGVKTTHHKNIWIGEQDYRPAADLIPVAAEPAAVVVPVMRRPQNAAPFMESLRASTNAATVYAMADPDDVETIAAWREAGAAVLIRRYADDRGGTFAEKVNFGAAETVEPWMFIVGDDVKFHPGWLDAAQHEAAQTGAKVIGTNDLGNPRVMAGEHGTHLLLARDYVDKIGASWDGPGVVCHEGYRHWFVDDEIVTAAKQRGVWASAGQAVVEHLHPLWGKSDDDAVYELGQSFAEHDRDVFAGRVASNA